MCCVCSDICAFVCVCVCIPQVKRLTDEAYANAKRILKKHEDKLHLLAKQLIEQETLTGEEVRKCLGLAEPVDKKPPQSLDDRKAAAVAAVAQKKSPLSAASS